MTTCAMSTSSSSATRRWPTMTRRRPSCGAGDNTWLIDLHAMSGTLLAQLGDAGSEDLFFPDDRSHFAEKGARIMAGIILKGIAAQVPALRR